MKLLMKIVLAGDGSVGKTSLRDRFLGRTFKSQYEMTIGADFALHEVNVADSSGAQHSVKFQIWDLAGQQRFKDVRSIYYLGCVGALLLFDVTQHESFQNLQNWIDEIWKHNGKNIIPLIILGNKIDLREQIPDCITDDEARDFTAKLSEITKPYGFNVLYFDTSAKTGLNVPEAFDALAQVRFKYLEAMKKIRLEKKNQLS